MKKPNISPLIVLTLLFAVLLMGFFHIKNNCRTPVPCEVISANPNTAAQSPSGERITTNDKVLININTATSSELTTLPGIGDTLAQRIVAYRNLHGRFQSVEQLLNVDGIGAGKLEAILDYITTGGM